MKVYQILGLDPVLERNANSKTDLFFPNPKGRLHVISPSISLPLPLQIATFGRVTGAYTEFVSAPEASRS